MIRTIVFFLIAVVDAAILTSIISTQLVLAEVESYGLAVSVGVRVQATLHDLLGLGVPLLLLIGLSFLIAFVIARHAIRVVGGRPMLWYIAAGFTSVPAALVIIKLFTGGTLLASARAPSGMLIVACCGMAGGWIFAYLRSRFGDPAPAGE